MFVIGAWDVWDVAGAEAGAPPDAVHAMTAGEIRAPPALYNHVRGKRWLQQVVLPDL